MCVYKGVNISASMTSAHVCRCEHLCPASSLNPHGSSHCLEPTRAGPTRTGTTDVHHNHGKKEDIH